MVASFTNEVLTITLKDGSTVSGKVTSQTGIECVSSTAAPTSQDDNESSEDNGSGDDQAQGDLNQQDQQQGDNQVEDQNTGDGQGDGETTPSSTEPPCDTSALTPGTVVREAELRVGPSGSEFESIELVR